MKLSNLKLVKIRGIIISGTCDLPAKAAMFRFQQHNAKYGCPKCKIKSKRINHVPVYEYKKNFKLRTTKDAIKTTKKVKDEPIKGVKGPTLLSKIVYNFIETTTIDAMHCIFINLGKKLLSIWFDSKFSKMLVH